MPAVYPMAYWDQSERASMALVGEIDHQSFQSSHDTVPERTVFMYSCERCRHDAHPAPTGIATKCTELADLTRIKTLCLRADTLSDMASRTSEGVLTALPDTSRMTSPVRMPCAAAGPSGFTSVTATPRLPLPGTLSAGARLRPRGAAPSALPLFDSL